MHNEHPASHWAWTLPPPPQLAQPCRLPEGRMTRNAYAEQTHVTTVPALRNSRECHDELPSWCREIRFNVGRAAVSAREKVG